MCWGVPAAFTSISLHAGNVAVLPVDTSLIPTAISTLPSLTDNQDSSTNDFQLEVIK